VLKWQWPVCNTNKCFAGSIYTGEYQPIFDVPEDGYFLMIESPTEGLRMVVVPNWRTELRRLTDGAQR